MKSSINDMRTKTDLLDEPESSVGSHADLLGARFESWPRLMWRERLRLFRFALIGLVCSLIVAFAIPVRYEAVARLMPPDQQNGMGSQLASLLTGKAGDALGGGIGSLAGDLLTKNNSGALVTGVLNSETVQNDIINKFDLRKVYWRKRYDHTRKKLAERTNITEDRKSGIITIKVEDTSPDRARQMAQAYVDELNGRMANLTTSAAHRERVFLEERLAAVKKLLDDSWLALSQFSSKYRTLSPDVQGRAMLESASSLEGQLIAAQAELKGLEQIYGPENARVRTVQAKAAELKHRLDQLVGQGPANSELEAGQLYPSIQQLPVMGNTYLGLYRQAKIQEAVYETLTKQYEMAKVSEAKEIPTIKELDTPTVPEGRSWPPRGIIMILGTFLFLLIGLFVAAAEVAALGMSRGDTRRQLVGWVAGHTPLWLRGQNSALIENQ